LTNPDKKMPSETEKKEIVQKLEDKTEP